VDGLLRDLLAISLLETINVALEDADGAVATEAHGDADGDKEAETGQETPRENDPPAVKPAQGLKSWLQAEGQQVVTISVNHARPLLKTLE
jgi:hypothetical protein